MSNQYPNQNPYQQQQQPLIPTNQYPSQANLVFPNPQQQQQHQQPLQPNYQQFGSSQGNQQQQNYQQYQIQSPFQGDQFRQTNQADIPFQFQQNQRFQLGILQNSPISSTQPGRMSTQQQSADVQKLKEEKKSLKDQIDKLNDDLEASTKKIKILEHDNSMFQNTIKKQNEKLKKKKERSQLQKSQNKRMEKETKAFEKEIERKNKFIQELKEESQENNNLRAQSTQQVEVSDQRPSYYYQNIISDLRDQLKKLQEKHDKLEQKYKEECDTLNAKVIQKQELVEELEKKLVLEEGYSQNRLDEIYKGKQEIKDLKSKLENKEQTLVTFKTAIQEQKNIQKDLENKLNYKEEDIEDLQSQLKNLKDQLEKTLQSFTKYQSASGQGSSQFVEKIQQENKEYEDDFQKRQQEKQQKRKSEEEEQKQQKDKQKALEKQQKEQLQADNQHKKQIAKTLLSKMKQSHGVIELCFVIDVTGSMDPYKEQTQKCIQQTIQHIKELTNREVHFAAVCYVDICDKKNSKDPYQQHNFTSDSVGIEKYLQSVRCSGGGDACEDVAGGLQQMCELSWSKPFKMAILICDSPAHGTRFNGGLGDNHPKNGRDLEKALEQMIKQDIMLVGLNFTKYTVVMYQEFEKIFKQYNKSDLFMTADLARVSQGNIWKEMVAQIATASVIATQTNSKATKSKNAQDNQEKTKDSAIEALCKAGNFYDFDNQPNVLTKDCTFQVYTVSLKESSLQQHIEEIENLKSEAHYELIGQGSWQCIRTQLPFAFGMMKQVFLMKKKKALIDELYVIKTPLNGKTYKTKQEAISECRSHLISQSLMRMYINDIKKALEEKGEINTFPNVIYSDFLILEEKEDSYWIAERFFKGEFVKYNNNYGYINDDHSTPIYQLALGFSYYTYFKSSFNYMVVDVQGVGNYFTDPAINTIKGTFDETDMGEEGITRFMVVFEMKKKMCEEILKNLLQIEAE